MSSVNLPGPKVRLLNTAKFLTDPYATSIAWRDRYGDPYLARTVNGDMVVTGRAEHIRAIFAAPPDTYTPFGVAAIGPVVGPRSLLILGGEAHKRERKLLMPPFHGARMKAYADMMRDVARRHFSAAASDGAPTTMQKLAQDITLEVIVRAIFGVTDDAEIAKIAEGSLAVVEAAHPAFLFAPWLQRSFGGLGPYAKFKKVFDASDADLAMLVEARRRRGPGDDILWMLLEARHDDGSPMADEDIRDELRTLIVAGHETTAMTLSFLVDYLARDAAALARVREEVQSGQSTLIDSAIKETLRLRPIVTESMRTLAKPMRLGDVEIPAGVHVSASMVLAHYDPERWPSPERFVADRFVGLSPAPTDYLPFGGGHRRCIGAAFAEMELRIVASALFAELDVALLSSATSRPVRRNLTMGPKDGVPVRLALPARASGHAHKMATGAESAPARVA